MPASNEFDPAAPQKEAAMFYGLFLRGHSADLLRQDIDIPKPLLEKWLSSPRYEPDFRENVQRLYRYRKQVPAIFDELIGTEKHRPRLQ